jgi:hypothetical protein
MWHDVQACFATGHIRFFKAEFPALWHAPHFAS